MSVNDPSTQQEWVAIGERIRAARVSAGISVRELARRIDVSASHVSQAERGLASFSVRALYNVVNELGISMDSLFDDTPSMRALPGAESAPITSASRAVNSALDEAGVVLRAAQRPVIPLASGTRWERLTPRPESGAEFIEVVYPPAPETGPVMPADFIRHASREYGVVISGVLTVQVGFDQTELSAGDSIVFDSMVPHRFWNGAGEEVRAVWFIWDAPAGDANERGEIVHGVASAFGAHAGGGAMPLQEH